MNEKFLQFKQRITEYWNKLNKTQKRIIIASAIISVLSVAILSYAFSRTEYSLAFTDLDPNDAAAIKNYLESANIPYRLSSDGRSIGVPSNLVAEVKLDVESQGLMQNGSLGFGIFRENIPSFGMPDNQFNVLHLDAISGEIRKMFRAINGVQDAQVMLTIPEESVFVNSGEQEQASASVVVTLKPGFRFDQAQVDTMYHLVAHSVPDLPLENITISDQNGNLLPYSKTNNMVDASANLAAQHFQIKKQFEEDIRKNVHDMLGKIFSRDKVIVSVVASLNFDKRNTREQLVTPVVDEQGIEISLEEIEKTYSSAGAPEGGIPGTGTNDIANYPGASETNANSEELQRRINYEVNRITNEVISSPFTVKDLTINVGIEPPVPEDPQSLTPETQEAVQRILMNIVAASLADSGQTYTEEEIARKVSVFAHSFNDAVVEPETGIPMAWLIAALAGALVLAGIAGVIVYRRRKAQAEAKEMMEQPASMEQQDDSLELEWNENQVRKQLGFLARTKPEMFVSTLRTWLAED